jgi:hypothetical protein
MRKLRKLSAMQIGAMFREATVEAAAATFKLGRRVTGLDRDGNIVQIQSPIGPEKSATRVSKKAKHVA